MAKDNRQMTPADQAAVVMALAKGATIREAAAGVGFAARTLFRRRNACALFAASWAAAVEESARPILVEPGPGRGWQVKRMRRNRFTRERKALFLGHLAATCDVQAACREAGICSWTAYEHRRTDPAFADGWRRARETGCALLEAEALRRRLAAMERIDFEIGEAPSTQDRIEDDLEFWRTMHLLNAHKNGFASGWTGLGQRRQRGRRPRVASNAEVRAALAKRLKAFRIRVRAGRDGRGANGDSYE